MNSTTPRISTNDAKIEAFLVLLGSKTPQEANSILKDMYSESLTDQQRVDWHNAIKGFVGEDSLSDDIELAHFSYIGIPWINVPDGEDIGVNYSEKTLLLKALSFVREIKTTSLEEMSATPVAANSHQLWEIGNEFEALVSEAFPKASHYRGLVYTDWAPGVTQFDSATGKLTSFKATFVADGAIDDSKEYTIRLYAPRIDARVVDGKLTDIVIRDEVQLG